MMCVLMVLALACVAACAGKRTLDDPALSERKLNLEEFFDGRVVAYGHFPDVFGTVRCRFDVEINGTWDGQP